MSDNGIIVQFKTRDGKIFETEDDAKEHLRQEKQKEEQRKARFQTLENKKKELRQITEHEYHLRAKLITECNCPVGEDYSVHCLRHFCTCQLETEFPDKEYEKVICRR